MRILEKVYNKDYSLKLVSYYEPLANNGWYEHSEFETQEWALENIREDWIIFDCGAHIGYYSMLFSHCAPQGKVYAFEACELTCQYFANNVIANRNEKNPYDNIELVNIALGNKVIENVEETLWLSGQGDGVGKTQGIFSFTTLDTFCSENNIQRLDLIKSDVDGWDYELLMGAYNTIATLRPIIIVEVNHAIRWRDHSGKDVKKLAKELGYTWSVLDRVSPSNWLLHPICRKG